MIACRRCGRPESAHWLGYCHLGSWLAIAKLDRARQVLDIVRNRPTPEPSDAIPVSLLRVLTVTLDESEG
jgi:hypothetical protein